MRRTVLVLSVLLVLLWAAADTLGQGKGRGKERGGEPAQRGPRAERVEREKTPPDAGKTQEKADRPPADKGPGKATRDEKPTGGNKGAKETSAAAKQAVGKAAGGKQEGEKGGAAKGKGHEQQLQALQKQLQHEQAKHMERRARLTRIRVLAVQKGDAEMIARVDKLMAKEQGVYDRKLSHVQQQRRALSTGVEPKLVGPAAKQKEGIEAGAADQKADDGDKAEKKIEDLREGDAPATPRPADDAGRASGRTKREKTQERAGRTTDAADKPDGR